MVCKAATIKTIWKYELRITDTQVVEMPDGAEVLHVGCQAGKICLWALVDPEAALIPYEFQIVGTGHPYEVGTGGHIGTAVIDPFVWHVFSPDLRGL